MSLTANSPTSHQPTLLVMENLVVFITDAIRVKKANWLLNLKLISNDGAKNGTTTVQSQFCSDFFFF